VASFRHFRVSPPTIHLCGSHGFDLQGFCCAKSQEVAGEAVTFAIIEKSYFFVPLKCAHKNVSGFSGEPIAFSYTF